MSRTTVSIILIILNMIIIIANVIIIMKDLYRMKNRYNLSRIILAIAIAVNVIGWSIWLYLF